MATTYTVKKGDTLWGISREHGTTIDNLVKLNNIPNPDYIVVGQVLILSGSPATTVKNTTSRATITVFGLQSNTDRTVYAAWTWDKSNTENYQVRWWYDTGDGVWFVGTDSTVNVKQSTYTAPTNAVRVRFLVKPVSKKRKVNNKETTYWTADWSTAKFYSFSSNPPTTPPVPTVTISNYTLTAKLDNLDVNAKEIQFQVVRNNTSVFASGRGTIKTTSASYSCTVEAGYEYKVRCRAIRDKFYSDWSNYSNSISTIPHPPSSISKCYATSETSVYLEWEPVDNAVKYDIEYTTDKKYFDGSDQTTTVTGIESTHYEKTGLATGSEYFFRIRAVNNEGNSSWSAISSVIIGKKPIAPTTWSSTTTVISGEALTLYWLHNCEDGSKQTKAYLELSIDGAEESYEISGTQSYYDINTAGYQEGAQIKWKVKTMGVVNEWGEWSTQRAVDIYAPPTLALSVTNNDGETLDVLTSFPVYISGSTGPITQKPIGYHVSIIANEAYETVDNVGNPKMINKGDAVYSKHFDTSEQLLLEISAGSVSLENNVEYTVLCTASMNSGLTAESSSEFTVSWTDVEYEPNAEISIDPENFSASIRPHCEDENGIPVDDILLSVYRREFDGRFTELATDIDNTSETFITDPHPALDYARYRIVAKSKTSGLVSYYDVPNYPVDGKAIVIQWDEKWTSFNSSNVDELVEPSWSGSMLKLPYNVDVSDSHKPDVSLVEYIGREHPVSYYGTQLGETSVWNVSIPKSDTETLYALRRLAIWKGDVYVREPSGSGYWAHITVSFGLKHRDTTIPVTIDIARVEGGV